MSNFGDSRPRTGAGGADVPRDGGESPPRLSRRSSGRYMAETVSSSSR